MSKVKNRHKKYRHKKHFSRTNVTDKHHLLWIGSHWNRGSLRELRNYPYCIVEIPKDTLHKHIHANMTSIPLPTEASARYVLQSLRNLMREGLISDDDSARERLTILVGLFTQALEPATADALRKQLHLIYSYNKKTP